MDVNNYSYINYNNKINTIASFETDNSIIELHIIKNYWGDIYYSISDLIGDLYETFIESIDARQYYNSLCVRECDMIPLF